MACAPGEIDLGFGSSGCIPTGDPVAFASKLYGISVGLLGGLAIIFLILGGYQILTSGGNQEKLSSGKRTIYVTLGAVGLIIAAGIILQVFLVDILAVPGVGK